VASSSRDTFLSTRGMMLGIDRCLPIRLFRRWSSGGCLGGMMLLSRRRLRSCSYTSSLSCLDSRSCSRRGWGTIVALLPAPAKLGRRYEPANEWLVAAPGAETVVCRGEVSDSESDSDAILSSSEASSRSLASEAWAVGEEADSERLRVATLSPIWAIGLDGVGMISSPSPFFSGTLPCSVSSAMIAETGPFGPSVPSEYR
jgi:hypothetical protein